MAEGSRCGKPIAADGLCEIHKAEIDRQRRQYQEMIAAAIEVCRVKGWVADLENEDESGHFATIVVHKPYSGVRVTGHLHLTLYDTIAYRIENTPGWTYGLHELQNAIGARFKQLPWIEKAADKERRKEADRKKQEELSTTRVITRVLRNFDRVARQLRRRRADRPSFDITDEYDAQDLLHAVLKAYFEDVRPEEQTPSHAGAGSRMDFLLKAEQAVVELKFATAKLRDRQIGEELIVDIKRYQAHPDCKALYCLVYDPQNHVKNPVGLERDLSRKHDGMSVTVVVVPQ